MTSHAVRLLVVLTTFAAVAACADGSSPTGPDLSPLTGLVRGSTNDSSPVTQPPDTSSGTFHGTVLGHVDGATGNDTLATLPRIAGVRLTAYTHGQPSSGDTLGVGREVASVVTDANGHFAFPTLAGGLYIVTIVPPDNIGYQGVYVAAMAYSRSGDYPWWIVLPKN